MDCPTCKHLMSGGYAKLGYTVGGFLWAGLSRLTLFFNGPGKAKTSVLAMGDKRIAYRCKRCDTVVMAPTKRRPVVRAK